MAPASMLLVWPSFIFGHAAPQFDWPLKALSFVYDVFVSCCFWLCFLFPYRFHLGFLKLLLQQVLAMPASKSLFSHHLDASTTVDEKLWFSASKNWGQFQIFAGNGMEFVSTTAWTHSARANGLLIPLSSTIFVLFLMTSRATLCTT